MGLSSLRRVAVELFTIQCTTCKARLVVKDESVIGDILACPKCNSMVQVVPPIGWRGADDSQPALDRPTAAPDPAASTQRAAATPKISETKQAAAAIPPALPARGSDTASPTSATASPTSAAATTAAAVETAETQPDTQIAGPATGGEAPTGAWTTIVARARRDWKMLAGGLAAGIALGATVWLVLVPPTPEPELVAEMPPSTDLNATDSVSAEAPRPATETSPSPAIEVAKTPAEPPTATLDARAGETRGESPSVDDNSVAEFASRATSAPLPDPPRPASASAANAASTAGPSLKLDPIPSGAGTGPTAGIGAFLTPSITVPPSAGNEPAATIADDRPAAVNPAKALAPEAPAEDDARLSPEDIESRLAVPLKGVRFDKVPLAQFATFVADVAGVRVLIDDQALAQAGKTRWMAIAVELDETTVGAALETALNGLGLTYAVEPGRIVIRDRKP